jgi:hypothetical protein
MTEGVVDAEANRPNSWQKHMKLSATLRPAALELCEKRSGFVFASGMSIAVSLHPSSQDLPRMEQAMAGERSASELEMNRADRVTLLDLVAAVDEFAQDDAELMATLRYMIDTGHVRLGQGTMVDLPWAA